MPIVKNFLTKFVNIKNHTHTFLHGALILYEAKNYNQHEELFEAWQKKITFRRVDKKGSEFVLVVIVDHLSRQVSMGPSSQ